MENGKQIKPIFESMVAEKQIMIGLKDYIKNSQYDYVKMIGKKFKKILQRTAILKKSSDVSSEKNILAVAYHDN